MNQFLTVAAIALASAAGQRSQTVQWAEVQPIFQQRCSNCHTGRVSPDLSLCPEAQHYALRIQRYIVGVHPPQELSLPEWQPSKEERETIFEWINEGAPCPGSEKVGGRLRIHGNLSCATNPTQKLQTLFTLHLVSP